MKMVTEIPPLPVEQDMDAGAAAGPGEFVTVRAIERAVLGSTGVPAWSGRRFSGDDFAGIDELAAAVGGARVAWPAGGLDPSGPPLESPFGAEATAGGVRRGDGDATGGQWTEHTAARSAGLAARSRRPDAAGIEDDFGAGVAPVLPGWWVVLSSAAISAVVFLVAMAPLEWRADHGGPAAPRSPAGTDEVVAPGAIADPTAELRTAAAPVWPDRGWE